ncbi:hypothetical protein VKT23_004246 [Stygiomarasmius scandens]|uniref:NAD-dependent epimerase/dehydratase domain-containing protein n=1 Tax=Marasmiellus scandens TaxID=2682957 RepID=A0ABR1JV31_9AGAR
MSMQRILVVGGNGFIGSAICRIALAKGMEVTSVSSSGRPYTTPKGHSPAWASKVTWLQGSAHNPSTFHDALANADGVVHTLGTLVEDGGKYKQAIREGNIPQVLGAVCDNVLSGKNPLMKGGEGSYEHINRDSALRVCEAFVSSGKGKTYASSPRPFVYISAEDVFRPVIPARYIETKREAEKGIEALLSEQYRGIYIRPSLVYHSHYRPLTTPAAALIDFSSTIHSKIPPGIPTPSQLLRSFNSILSAGNTNSELGSPLESMANCMTIPPIHVDHVAEAVCAALTNQDVQGVVGVWRMRGLIGWRNADQATLGNSNHTYV